MNRLSPEAKVGLLVLGAALLLGYMSLRLGNLGVRGEGGYSVFLLLDNASGLSRDGDVLVAGITVGSIQEIRLHDHKALLVLRVQNRAKLPKDSTAGVKTHGVLGEKYIEVVPGQSGELLHDGDWLRSGAPPGDLDRLLTNLGEISNDVKRVTERLANVFGTAEGERSLRDILEGFRGLSTGLRDVVADNRAALRESVQNLRALTADVRLLVEANRQNIDQGLASARKLADTLSESAPRIAGNVEKLTGDLAGVVEENRENLRQSLSNLNDATSRLSATLDSARSLMDSAQNPNGTLGRLLNDDALYDELRTAVGELGSVLGRIERGEGSLGKLVADDALYTELRGSAENLRNVSEKIDQGHGTLGKLVNDSSVHDNLNTALEGFNDLVTATNRFQFELGYRGEFLTRLGEAKHYFDLEIRPRQDRFYFLSLVDDPRGFEDTKTTVRTGTGGPAFETKTVTSDKMKFSVGVGKRFSFLTLRGGILESSGGIGADLNLWSDRLRLSAELFDFAREKSPRPNLKLSARWNFWNHLFLTGGFDDVLDRDRSDVFVGAGLRFIDDDLKYLLSPAAGLAK